MGKAATAEKAGHSSGLEVGQRVQVSKSLGDFGGGNVGKVVRFKSPKGGRAEVGVKIDGRPADESALYFHSKDVTPA